MEIGIIFKLQIMLRCVMYCQFMVDGEDVLQWSASDNFLSCISSIEWLISDLYKAALVTALVSSSLTFFPHSPILPSSLFFFSLLFLPLPSTLLYSTLHYTTLHCTALHCTMKKSKQSVPFL